MSTHRITIEPLGAELDCREDQTILDAFLREGIWLPHACTHGTCGTCKAEILDGEVDFGDASPYALLDSERAEGCALLCVARPRGDLVVEADVDVEDGVDVHPVRDHCGIVDSVVDIARDVRRVTIDLDTPLRFNPGQYVMLNVPGAQQRPYSIASTPSRANRIELHIKRSAGGLATDGWIFKSMTAGERVTLSGPYGRFSLRPAREEPILLLGSGTGLAPLKSMPHRLCPGRSRARWPRLPGCRQSPWRRPRRRTPRRSRALGRDGRR